MNITAAHTDLLEILVQFLCHTLGQSSHEHPLIQFRPLTDLFQKIVDLIFSRAHLDRRIKQSCRPYDLLYHKTFRLLQFVICRCSTDKHLLTCNSLELIKLQRSVIRCGRQSESVIDQYRFS